MGTARPGKAWSRGHSIAGFLEEGRLEDPGRKRKTCKRKEKGTSENWREKMSRVRSRLHSHP